MNAYAVRLRADLADGLAWSDHRARRAGEINVGVDRRLRHQVSAVGLEHADELLRYAESGETTHQRVGVEDFMRERVRPRRLQRSFDERAARCSDLEHAGDVEQRSSR